MAKTKPPGTAVQAISASPDVRTDEFTDQHRDLAQWLQLDLSVSLELRAERAVRAYNMATLHMVEAGLLLASMHAEVGADAFTSLLDERGLPKQRAYELMQGASLAARLPVGQREQVLGYSKSKVLALASASPAAVQAALEDEDLDIDLISVRALRQRIRELEATTTDLQVQRDTAEAEAAGLKKRLDRGLPDRSDQVPQVIADLRAEILALGKKASLAVDSFTPLGAELVTMAGHETGHPWADATLRLAVTQLQALEVQLHGLVHKYRSAFRDEDAAPVPTSYLTQQEMNEAAAMFEQLTQAHGYEARLREWEREQGRPKGKGRPKAKPLAPGAAA